MSIVMGPDTATDRDQKLISLVDRYQEPLLRMCCLYLRDRSLAEDAVQETFIKAYRALDSFRGESSEKTWLMRIAMHICCDINRTGWFRFMNRNHPVRLISQQICMAILISQDQAAPPPEERDEELAAAVMKLPRRLREVILLYYYQGMNVNEIADALNLSHSSVSGRLKRGREKLKNMLEGRELDE